MDLVLAIDSSSSVIADNVPDPLQDFTLQKNFLKNIVQGLPVGTDTRVSTVRYASDSNVFFRFNDYENSINIQDAIWSIRFSGGSTNTAGALQMISDDVMGLQNGARPGARDVLVILTDGLSNMNQNFTAGNAQLLKDAGFEIFTVATSKEVNMAELEVIASSPVSRHLFQTQNSSALEDIVDTVVHRICNLPDPTVTPTPENGKS